MLLSLYIFVSPFFIYFFFCLFWRINVFIITGPLALNGMTLLCGLFKWKCRQYSRGNAESAYLKIISLVIKCSLPTAVLRDISIAIVRRPTITDVAGRSFTLSQVVPVTLPQSNSPSRSLAPLVKAHTKLPVFPYRAAGYRNGNHCEIRICGYYWQFSAGLNQAEKWPGGGVWLGKVTGDTWRGWAGGVNDLPSAWRNVRD